MSPPPPRLPGLLWARPKPQLQLAATVGNPDAHICSPPAPSSPPLPAPTPPRSARSNPAARTSTPPPPAPPSRVERNSHFSPFLPPTPRLTPPEVEASKGVVSSRSPHPSPLPHLPIPIPGGGLQGGGSRRLRPLHALCQAARPAGGAARHRLHADQDAFRGAV
eukprot:scaffold23062_cov121-Isochrysis_galbana.AAC.2